MTISLMVIGAAAILVVGIAIGSFFNYRFPSLTLERVVPRIYLVATFAAIALVFLFGPTLVFGLLLKGTSQSMEQAEDIFSTITHIGAIVITYWFASGNGKNGGRNGPEPIRSDEDHQDRGEQKD